MSDRIKTILYVIVFLFSFNSASNNSLGKIYDNLRENILYEDNPPQDVIEAAKKSLDKICQEYNFYNNIGTHVDFADCHILSIKYLKKSKISYCIDMDLYVNYSRSGKSNSSGGYDISYSYDRYDSYSLSGPRHRAFNLVNDNNVWKIEYEYSTGYLKKCIQ
ncbi:hypothetical protein [Neisseria maigaei]|uniref:hypothetical protein n=1 Tax=Neisseria maigaei TaxID=2830651 RepID=UPI00265A5A5B|nr:hypothetical protein [Neisseria maigaei]